jgi:hypothetical protein
VNESDKATLASIEAVLIADRASVREALKAAYDLGFNEGALRMAGVAQKQAEQLLRAVTP